VKSSKLNFFLFGFRLGIVFGLGLGLGFGLEEGDLCCLRALPLYVRFYILLAICTFLLSALFVVVVAAASFTYFSLSFVFHFTACVCLCM